MNGTRARRAYTRAEPTIKSAPTKSYISYRWINSIPSHTESFSQQICNHCTGNVWRLRSRLCGANANNPWTHRVRASPWAHARRARKCRRKERWHESIWRSLGVRIEQPRSQETRCQRVWPGRLVDSEGLSGWRSQFAVTVPDRCASHASVLTALHHDQLQ